MKIGDKVKIKGTSEVVQITGKSGTWFRVYISGTNKHHDWYPPESLERI